MLVGIRDAPVVFFAEFVFRGIGVGVAPLPERLDEVVALFIVRQAFEGLQFLVGDDPAHILVHPLLVGALELVSQFLLLLEFFLIAQRPF